MTTAREFPGPGPGPGPGLGPGRDVPSAGRAERGAAGSDNGLVAGEPGVDLVAAPPRPLRVLVADAAPMQRSGLRMVLTGTGPRPRNVAAGHPASASGPVSAPARATAPAPASAS